MLPARDPERSGELHLVFLASPSAVRGTLAQLLGAPQLAHLSHDDRGKVELVLAEVLNNVAEHAYAATTGPVSITLAPVADGVRCLVVDQGAAMPGGQLPTGRLPGTDTALPDLPEGGFGWHLIRSLTQGLAYARSGNCNRLGFLIPTGDWCQ